jgi:hypothetical protein
MAEALPADLAVAGVSACRSGTREARAMQAAATVKRQTVFMMGSLFAGDCILDRAR